MKVTVVSREITDTVEEFEIPVPSLYKVNKYKYVYFSDKSREVALVISIDNGEFFDIFINMTEVNFLETNVACNVYKINTLTPITDVDVNQLLESVINKFKSFV